MEPDPIEQTWLTLSKPASYARGADVVLVLTDDGSKELPAHAAVLAAQSPVLSDIFYGSDCKPEADAHGNPSWRLTLPHATLKQATSFLDFVYCLGEYDLTVDAVHSMVELLHRFECKAALQKMDAYLALEAGNAIANKARFWVRCFHLLLLLLPVRTAARTKTMWSLPPCMYAYMMAMHMFVTC